MKPLFKAVFILTIFSIITRLLGFVFHIYLSRALGAEMLGLYQVASAFIGILMTIVCSGIPLTTAKLTSRYTAMGDLRRKNRSAGSAFVIALSLSVALCAIVYLGQDIFSHIFADERCVEIMICMLPAVIFSAVYAVLRGVMWGQNKFFSVSITELFEQVVRIVLTIVLLVTLADKAQSGVMVSKAFSIACLCSALLACVLFFRFNNKLDFSKGEYRNVFASASAITGIRLTNSISAPLASIIVPAQLIACGLSQSESLALYGVMMGMTTPLLYIPMSFIGSLGMALVPNLASQLARKDYAGIRTSLYKSFAVVLFLSFVFIPIFLSVGNCVTAWIYNDQMAGILLQRSAILIVPIAMCGMSNSILNGMSLENKSFWNYLVGSASMLLILLTTTRFIGIDAVIVANGVSNLIICALNLRLLYKHVPELKLDIMPKVLKYTLICIPTALLGHWTHNLLCININPIISAVVCSIIMCVAYCLLAVCFGLVQMDSIITNLRRRKMLKTPV